MLLLLLWVQNRYHIYLAIHLLRRLLNILIVCVVLHLHAAEIILCKFYKFIIILYFIQVNDEIGARGAYLTGTVKLLEALINFEDC